MQLKLLYEILVNQPQLLAPLISQLQDFMEVEDADERQENVTMFGDVFKDVKSLSPVLEQLLQNLIKRHRDIAPDIRVWFAELSGELLIKFEPMRDVLLEALKQMTTDKEDRVRKAVVDSVCASGLTDPALIPHELLTAIGDRIEDRKESVRQASQLGLSKLFMEHCAASWKECKALPAASKRYSWIPRKVIGVLRYKDGRLKHHFMDSLLHSVFLGGDSFSLLERARCLIGIFASLDEPAQDGLKRLLRTKRIWQGYVLQLLDTQNTVKTHSRENKMEYEHLLRKRTFQAQQIVKMLSLNTDVDKGTLEFIRILEHKNKDIRKWLSSLCSESGISYDDTRLAQKELARAIRTSVLGTDKKRSSKKRYRPQKRPTRSRLAAL
jgi:sister-chromatid-cohesion protein PDS5